MGFLTTMVNITTMNGYFILERRLVIKWVDASEGLIIAGTLDSRVGSISRSRPLAGSERNLHHTLGVYPGFSEGGGARSVKQANKRATELLLV